MKCGKRNAYAAAILAGIMAFSGAVYAAGNGFHEPEPLGNRVTNFAGGAYAEHRLEEIAEENGEKPETQSETTAETKPQTIVQSESKPQTETQPQTAAPEPQTPSPINVVQTDTNTPQTSSIPASATPQTAGATTPQTETPAPHRYELVQGGIPWDQAEQKAESKGGYLVNINSFDEFNTILGLISQQDMGSDGKPIVVNYLIGGKRDLYASFPENESYYWIGSNGTIDTSAKINDTDYWVNKYHKWFIGPTGTPEPSFRDNSVNKDEYVLEIFYYQAGNSDPYGQNGQWLWNDVMNDITPYYNSDKVGYIIEYDK